MRRILLVLVLLLLLAPVSAHPGMSGRYRLDREASTKRGFPLPDVTIKFTKKGQLILTQHVNAGQKFRFKQGGSYTVQDKKSLRKTRMTARWDDDKIETTEINFDRKHKEVSRVYSTWTVSKDGKKLSRTMRIPAGNLVKEPMDYVAVYFRV